MGRTRTRRIFKPAPDQPPFYRAYRAPAITQPIRNNPISIKRARQDERKQNFVAPGRFHRQTEALGNNYQRFAVRIIADRFGNKRDLRRDAVLIELLREAF